MKHLNFQKGISLVVVVIILAVIFIGGGAYYFKQQAKPIVADATANWKTYTNTQYGFSIKYPEELETIQIVSNKDNTSGWDGCIIGEEVQIYFFKKGDAPPPEYGSVGGSLFEGVLASSDFRWLDYSTKNGNSCGGSGSLPPVRITLNPPFQLFSTSVTAQMPVQAPDCGIGQTTAKLSVGKYYSGKYNTFELFNPYLKTADLVTSNLTRISSDTWKTECPKIFSENILKLEPEIKQFDLMAKSLKFLNK